MKQYVEWLKGRLSYARDPKKPCPILFSGTCKKVGISYGRKVENGIIFHDFRRTFKTNLVSAGIDQAIRDTILGHRLPGMDDHYIKLNNKALHHAMEKYTEWLDEQLSEAGAQQNANKVTVT